MGGAADLAKEEADRERLLQAPGPRRTEDGVRVPAAVPVAYGHPRRLDASADPATVTIPVTSAAMRSPVRERLGEVAVALSTDCGSLVVRSRKKR